MENPSADLPVAVAALYRFARFERFAEFRQPLLDMAARLGIKGTLLLAREGINGTVAGTPKAIDALIAYLEAIAEISGMEIKYSHAAVMPFRRMKVRLKREIVTMGVTGIDPLKSVGTYVTPRDWNAMPAPEI